MVLGLIVLLMGISFSSASASVTPANCLVAFATTALDGSPADIVADTYLQLWKELGGGNLDREAVAEVIRRENPFDLSLGKEGIGGVLYDKMKQFEAMVVARGWNTPEVRNRLLQELASLSKTNERAAENQDLAVRREAKPVLWESVGSNVFVAPDGKLMLLAVNPNVNRPPGSTVPKADQVFDPDTGNVKQRAAAPQQRSMVAYSPDGKEGYFVKDWKVVARVPFRDGFFHWGKARVIDELLADQTQLVRLPSTARLMSGNDQWPLYVFDLKTRNKDKQKLEVDVSALPLYDKGKPHGWGAIPGSDQFFLSSTNSKGDYWVGKYELDADGKLLPVGNVKRFRLGKETSLQTAGYGTGILATSWKRADYIDPVTLQSRTLVKFKESQRAYIYGDGVLTADGKSALLLIDPFEIGDDRTVEQSMYVLRIDVATGEERGRTPLGTDTEYNGLTALPDGRCVVVGDDDVKRIFYPF